MCRVCLAIAILVAYTASLRADSCGPPEIIQVPDVCGLTLLGIGGRFDVPPGKPYMYAEVVGRQRVQLWRGERKVAETMSDDDGKFAFAPIPEGRYLLKVVYTEGVGINRLVDVTGMRARPCRKPLFAYLGPEGWPCRASLDSVKPLTLAPDAIHKKP